MASALLLPAVLSTPGDLACAWPADATAFSLITHGDARISSHTHPSGLAIGGTLKAPTASLFARVASSVDWLVSGRRSVVLGVDDARAAEEGGAAAIAGGARTPQPRVGIRSTWKPAPPSAPPPTEAEGQGQEAIPATSRSRFYHVFGGW